MLVNKWRKVIEGREDGMNHFKVTEVSSRIFHLLQLEKQGKIQNTFTRWRVLVLIWKIVRESLFNNEFIAVENSLKIDCNGIRVEEVL